MQTVIYFKLIRKLIKLSRNEIKVFEKTQNPFNCSRQTTLEQLFVYGQRAVARKVQFLSWFLR